MPTARYIRTVNPLQFHVLEPKRFEDLVRRRGPGCGKQQQGQRTGS